MSVHQCVDARKTHLKHPSLLSEQSCLAFQTLDNDGPELLLIAHCTSLGVFLTKPYGNLDVMAAAACTLCKSFDFKWRP